MDPAPQDPIEVVILAKVGVELPDGTCRDADKDEKVIITRRSADYLIRTKRARLASEPPPEASASSDA